MKADEELIAAADLLDKRAAEAAMPWKPDSDNHLGLLTIAMPYTIGFRKGHPTERFYLSGPDDKTTRYIATMHPEVGKALADLMRVRADQVRRARPHPDGGDHITSRLLIIARLINSKPPESIPWPAERPWETTLAPDHEED